ncbi:DUF1501 domain-containing protein [Thalassotalea sp. PLHSN55]|uniref:DUF1501 domain-containing protein n=1 Tax=Thalassotalea sp. PLHSN55 TaxID=3435888 RepID=UPI003F86E176
MQRRQFMKSLAASLVVFQSPLMANVLVNKAQKQPKIVWLILRGGLDSLHTVVPTFDDNLKTLRPSLNKAIKDKTLQLDNGYALHPALKNLHSWYQQKQLLPVVAVSSGYRERSHFDAQDFLESGKAEIDHQSGWLGRLVAQQNKAALAIARSTPITMRGNKAVDTWYPSKLKEADDDIYQALSKMYQEDELLSERLASGMAVEDMTMSNDSKKQQGNFIELAKSCGTLLKGEQGVDCAMLELGGWDTHNNQANRLNRQLSTLDKGLALLKQTLGEHWQETLVVVATEFGRTAKENGTAGTDHGSASAMFLAGGAVNGGQVLGQWPGLAQAQLFEQRDLKPTSSTFSWIATAIKQHWQLDTNQINEAFPSAPILKHQLIKT